MAESSEEFRGFNVKWRAVGRVGTMEDGIGTASIILTLALREPVYTAVMC